MTVKFTWHSPRATLWRLKLKQWAEFRGIYSFEELQATLGPKWAYRNRESIRRQCVDWGQDAKGFCAIAPFREYARDGGKREQTNLHILDIQDRAELAKLMEERDGVEFLDAFKWLSTSDALPGKRKFESEMYAKRNPF